MVYRAKISEIQCWVEDHYDLKYYRIILDENDVYIEVTDEHEAELLESMNKKREELLALEKQFYEDCL